MSDFVRRLADAYRFFDTAKIREGLRPEWFQTKIITLEELETHQYLALFHSTTDMFLGRILEEGLQPNGVTGNRIEDGLPTEPDKVYLHTLSHGNENLYQGRAVKAFGGRGITVECLVDRNCLQFDENSLSPKQLAEFNQPSDPRGVVLGLQQFGQTEHLGAVRDVLTVLRGPEVVYCRET